MKETILTTTIPRERGFIYFTGTSPEGNVTLMRTIAGKKKKEVQK